MPNDTDEKVAGGNGSAPEHDDDEAKAHKPPKSEPAPQTIEDMITELEQKSQKLEQTNRELHDRLLRTAADFENWKKRTKKELDESAQKGREGLLKEMLPVIDNLERALKHAAGDDPMAQGVRMVEKLLLAALEKFGITRFSAAGQAFDPALHDAIQQIETDEHAPGTVAQDFASGYLSNGRLFRAALVGVAKKKEGQ